MRKKIVAGNWKMNLNNHEALELITEITNLTHQLNNSVQIIIAPPFLYLKEAVELTSSYRHISIAAQNCSNQEKGAFTGEISASMLQSVGAEYVIIGHSERRTLYHETHHSVKDKIDLALANNLTPIFCVGESLEERSNKFHFDVITRQVKDSIKHLTAQQLKTVVIAYEPVWAIGTGLTATPEQAQEMHAHIRDCIAKISDAETASSISILYGGSCNENNAKELFACADIDGGLIGGASLKAESFHKIISSL